MLGELEISCRWEYEHYCCFCFCFVTQRMLGLTASAIQEVEFGMAHYSWLSKWVDVCVGGSRYSSLSTVSPPPPAPTAVCLSSPMEVRINASLPQRPLTPCLHISID